MTVKAERPREPIQHGPANPILPTSVLGRWAVGLAAAFFPLVFSAGLVPLAAALGIVCGVAGGALALVAIIRDGDRAVTVFAGFLPLVIALAFVLVQVIAG